MPNWDKLVKFWKDEEHRSFAGWDFSYLDDSGRMSESSHPWSYMKRAGELMKDSSSVIDMGTGGGERLLELREFWPEKVVVTEEYEPNLKLVIDRLVPLGVKVKSVQLGLHNPMPFDDEEFDLVLNRHSGFNCQEVTRILKSDGLFLTQQVDGRWTQDLLAAFGTKPQWPFMILENSVKWLKETGLEIKQAKEWSSELKFSDVGAIVYYLKAVPWLVPGFSVDTHINYLKELQVRLDNGHGLCFEARKYYIEAQKVCH